MRLRFSKMHGLGNDFVVIDGISQKVRLNADKVRYLADRRFGVGCDQVLLVESPTRPDRDFRYRIFNADGQEVESCSTGARCFARFVRDRRLTGKRTIEVETASGDLTLQVLDNDQVCVPMGIPQLEPADIPFQASARALTYELEVNERMVEISALSMGDPHAVIMVDEVASAPLAELGPLVESHPRFAEQVNVGFMQIVSPAEIHLRVYQRGLGETLGCDTGACAAVVAGRLRQLLEPMVKVNLPGGQLSIHWPGPGQAVTMTGPATTVFHGQVNL